VVATPIGNLADITLRALDLLAAADLVACEDTRHTGKLLAAHGIRARLVSYNDHNAPRVRPRLIAELKAGAIVCLVSDAGTPLVSDPGYRLVVEAIGEGIAVHPLPGPSAALAALTVAGLPTDRFYFAGYLPARAPARRRALEGLAAIDATLVVLESPHRIAALLADAAGALGARPAALARELTKLHEEVVRAPLDALAEQVAAHGLRGECVLVIGPPQAPLVQPASDEEVDALLRAALAENPPARAAQAVAARTGRARKAVYARAIALRKQAGGGEGAR
jgi:16S rRNA (cytidine1402-2'-O)-methyltransferase